MATLPEDLESLLAGQPPVDWPGAVGQVLARRQQRRLAVAGLAALLVAAVLGTTVVLAGGDDDPEPRQSAADLTPSPVPTSASPTPTPSPTPSREPIPEVVPELVSLPPDRECELTAPPARPLPDVRTRGNALPNDVDLSVDVNCTLIEVGAPFFVRATSTATQAKATQFSSTLGPDGLAEPLDNSGCTGEPNPGAGSGAATAVLSDTFTTVGVQEVTVLATTADPCVAKPGGAAVTFEITVVPAVTPTPTPSPSPSPSPSPTPSPSSKPSPSPTPTVVPAPQLTIEEVTTTAETATPGERVPFLVTVTSNVGRPVVSGTTAGVPETPLCPARQSYSPGQPRAFRIPIQVRMPGEQGNAVVDILAVADSGCLDSGERLVSRSVYQIKVVTQP